ncbi:MAG: hypothetical protein WCA00_13740 [Candidatus Acidiferrales bacterium]
MRILFAVLLLASSAFAQTPAPLANPEAACGQNDVQFDVKKDPAQHLPETNPSKAVVYIIQDERPIGVCIKCTITTRVGLDGSWIGANNGASYFSVAVDPGEHHLCANWQSHFSVASRLIGLIGFTAEAGRTYYFRIRILDVGGNRNLPDLELDAPNVDEARYLIATSPFSVSRPKK